MARGWESKAVEDQVREFQSKDADAEQKANVTPREGESLRRRKVQALAVARVRSQLETCSDPRYREQLERALADLEKLVGEDLPR